MSERKGKILTVNGLIEASWLGTTLTHEHLSLKADGFYLPPANANDVDKTHVPFAMENLGWIRQNPYSHKPNVTFVGEDETVVEEIKQFKELGGQSIVENSTIGLRRDIPFLKRLSTEAGVNIIAGTGFYVDGFQSESVRQMTEEAMAELIRQEIILGVGESQVCCGVIGEIGCSWPLTEFEKKSLRSSAAIQDELGSPAIIHPGRNVQAPFEIIRIFLEAGGQANRVVMSHLDRTLFTTDDLLEFAKLGCYCEYDMFGIETSHYQFWLAKDMPSDAARIGFIRCLVDAGHDHQVVIAHDVHTKHRLKKYGGHGYTHILENIVPKMQQRGISNDSIEKIIKDNPQTWLTFQK